MLLVITSIPSPYQVELFDAVAAREPDFRAVYVTRRDRSRNWDELPLRHRAIYLDEAATPKGAFFSWAEKADLVVFSDYSSKIVREAMRRRAASDKAWCFWGERPGYHRLGWLGRIWRRIHLAPLHNNRHVPICGIGQWAVDGYRREFGADRLYCNLPYFSDLQRFRAAGARRCVQPGTVRLLYSGALIKRKGVDVLARAFRRLSRLRDNVTLSVLGTGPLRPLMENELSGLEARVHFHGFVSWQDLPGLYTQADVLCAPSRYDGWGLIVPEGMAAGMPVIATDRMGAALEMIVPGKNGWLIRGSDETQLFQALCDVADIDPGRRMAMGIVAQSCSDQQGLVAGARRFFEAVEQTQMVWDQPVSGTTMSAEISVHRKALRGSCS